MPDGEIFPGVSKRWLGAAHLLGGRAEPDEVARSITKALAQTLRKEGLPGLDSLSRIVELQSIGRTSVLEAQAEVAAVEPSLPPTQGARIALTTVERLLVREETRDAADVSAQHLVAERYCQDVVDVSLLGPVGPTLLGARFRDYQELAEFKRSVCESLEPSIRSFVESLVRDPSGASVKAPAGSVSRKTPTSELLYRPLE